MNKLKVLLGSSVASFALVAGLTLPAAAATQTCSVEDVTLGVAGCLQNSTEVNQDSPTNESGNQATQGGTVVSGDCNVLNSSVYAQGGNGGNGGNGNGGVAGAGGAGGSATASQNIEADCSTTNVTNVTKTVAAEKAPVVAQVTSAPKGGVHAGSGSTATNSSSAVALVGLTGSLSVVGLGLRFLKGEL